MCPAVCLLAQAELLQLRRDAAAGMVAEQQHRRGAAGIAALEMGGFGNFDRAHGGTRPRQGRLGKTSALL